MPISSPTVALHVTVEGAALERDLLSRLESVRVREHLGAPATAEVSFDDPDLTLLDRFDPPLGASLEVRFGDGPSTDTLVFGGEVTGVAFAYGEGGEMPRVRLTASDLSHRLGFHAAPTGHANMSTGDIVRAVARRHGLEAEVEGAGTSPNDHLLEADTERALLDRLAADDGCEWFVREDALVYRPRGSEPAVTFSRDEGSLLAFSAAFDAADLPAGVVVTGWDLKQKQSVVEMTSLSDVTLTSTASLFERKVAQHEGGNAQRLTRVDAGPATEQRVGARARATADLALRRAVRVEGTAIGDPRVRAGAVVAVVGVGSKLSGAYHVSEVEHEYGRGRSTISRFKGSVGAGTDEPTPRRWGGGGLTIGVVTNVDDETAAPRCKVRYVTLDGAVESGWARILALGAGSKVGVDVRPSVNDEVLLGFERDDPSAPVVLGGLWSEAVVSPAAFDPDGGSIGEQQGTGLPERSNPVSGGETQRWEVMAPGGNQLTFSQGGTPFVRLALRDGAAFLTMSDEGTTLQAVDGTPLVLKAGDASITLDDEGKITLAGKGLVVQAGQEPVTVDGKELQVKVQNGAKLESSMGDIELKGMNVKAQATAIAELKGSLVKLN